MNRLALILLGGALAAPGIAYADWQKSCQAGAANTVHSLNGGGSFVCHTPSAATDSPSVLDINNCENIDIIWFDNQTGDGSGDADGTATLYTCPVVVSTAMDTDTERRLACQPMNAGSGTVLSATASEVYGVGGVRIWADVADSSAENLLIVRCSQPSVGK